MGGAVRNAEEGVRGDLQWVTIPGLLADAVARRGGAEAVVDRTDPERGRFSFDELAARVEATTRGMLAAGVEPGDAVAIWAPNCWEWVVALLALQSAGGVLVPLNTRYKGREAADILRRSRAKLLFTVEGFLGNDYVSMLRNPDVGETPHLKQIVLLRTTGDVPEGTVTSAEFVVAGESVDPSAVADRVASLTGDHTSDLLFTSGTTGSPKGVVQTHGQTLRAFGDWSDVVGLRNTDRYLVINPFFHAFGYKAGILAALMAGATIVPLAVFDVDAAVETISAEQISMIPGPPTLYQTILGHPAFDPAKVTSLRLAVTGAAVVPVELVHQMRDVLGFETVITGYGLTEACGVATMCRHDDDPETIANTSGRAIPGVDVLVVDPEGNEVPRGEAGEVVVAGYNVMKGYFESPEQTAETIDDQGRLHTGDVGIMDERGYLRITDRMKDMFIVGGFNAYPAEIEQLLLAHPDVAQAAVVGVPDERMGEIGYAFVVPAPGATLEPAAVVAWAKENMANYKAPRFVEVVDAFPLNASGKVLKFELRQRAVASLGGN
jgi:acyl-CoA synthetase (AMP-forming)/AMP-acid ligase II